MPVLQLALGLFFERYLVCWCKSLLHLSFKCAWFFVVTSGSRCEGSGVGARTLHALPLYSMGIGSCCCRLTACCRSTTQQHQARLGSSTVRRRHMERHPVPSKIDQTSVLMQTAQITDKLASNCGNSRVPHCTVRLQTSILMTLNKQQPAQTLSCLLPVCVRVCGLGKHLSCQLVLVSHQSSSWCRTPKPAHWP